MTVAAAGIKTRSAETKLAPFTRARPEGAAL